MENILTKRSNQIIDSQPNPKRQKLNPEEEILIKQLDDHNEITIDGITAKIPLLKDNHLRVKKDIPLKEGGLKNLMSVAEIIISNQTTIKNEPEEEESPEAATAAATAVGEESIRNRFGCQVVDLDSYEHRQIAEINLVQDLAQNDYGKALKIKERLNCNQQIFRRVQSDGCIDIIWAIYKVGEEEFFNRPFDNFIKHYIQSGLFESTDGMMWRARLMPGVLYDIPNGEEKVQRSTASDLILFLMPKPGEQSPQKVNIKYTIHSINNFVYQNQVTHDFSPNGEIQSVTLPKFDTFFSPIYMNQSRQSEVILIQFKLEHLVPCSSVSTFKNLKNEGQTCYLDSMIQTLFFLRKFRAALYQLPPALNEVPLCLQRLFYKLEFGTSDPVRTIELIKAFGWNEHEQNRQQDIDEFNRELKLKLGMPMNLFEGKTQQVIQCVNIKYESCQDDVQFDTIGLSLNAECKTIEDAIRHFVEPENLEGENMYDTEKFGKQNAKKFIRFKQLPPVLQISLNRFEFDMDVQQAVKNNQMVKFSEILDFESVLSKQELKHLDRQITQRYRLFSILIHKGTIDFGHYYAYINPNLENRWYEFDDLKQGVHEVTKNFAFKQGIGGQFSEFKPIYQNSEFQFHHLLEQFQNCNINAYMLYYIRESDISQIMQEKIEIPQELKTKFENEETLRNQIIDDFDNDENFKRCYVITDETIQINNYDGPLISQPFRQENIPEGYDFESNNLSHHKLLINQNISTNEFITMLQQRYFQDMQPEDITIYRISHMKAKNSINQYYQYAFKVSYNQKADSPLFLLSNKQIAKSIVIYIKGQVLQPLTEKEIENQNKYYDEIIDFVKTTSMENAEDFVYLYQKYKKQRYRFIGSKEGDYRHNFIFKYDADLRNLQLAQQESLQDEAVIESTPKQYLCFIKTVDFKKGFIPLKTIFISEDKPLDIAQFGDPKTLEIFVEDCTKAAVKYKEINTQKVLEPWQTEQMTLLKVNNEEAMITPSSNWLQGDGLCLNIYQKENDEQILLYQDMYQEMNWRGYFNLCLLVDNITSSQFEQKLLGVIELNYLDDFETIQQKIAKFHGCEAENVVLFSHQYRVITYNDRKTIQEISQEALSYIKTKENYINFMIMSKIKFEQYDNLVEIQLKVFLKHQIKCHDDKPFYKVTAPRNMTIKDFMIKFMQVNKFHTETSKYLALQLDRETCYIKKIYDEDLTLDDVVGSPWTLSFNNLPKVFRIQEIESTSSCFAFIQLINSQKQNIGEQLVLPFNYNSTTFNQLFTEIETIAKSLFKKQMSLKLIKMKFDHKTDRNGKIQINYKASKLEFEIDLEVNGEYKIGPIFIEQENSQNYTFFAVMII